MKRLYEEMERQIEEEKDLVIRMVSGEQFTGPVDQSVAVGRT